MPRAEILWQDGVFSCEYRRTTSPHICLSKFEEAGPQIPISSTPEALEQACALRILVMNNLAANRWIEA